MASPFYTRMKGVADRLLTQYGHSINLVSLDQNGAQTVLDTYQGLKAPVRVDNTPQTVLESSEATVYITSAIVEPDATHYIFMDGSLWKIIYVEPVRPTDLTILYTLFVAKGA